MSMQLTDLNATLDAYAQGTLPLSTLAQQWRHAASSHAPALPARYIEVLDRILSQLESAALFTEESCSFSQADMLAALRDWLSRAQAL